MKKIIYFLLVFAFCVLNQMPKNLVAENPEKIRLGAILPLTADYASYGKLIQDGIELAKNEAKQSGLEVETAYEDLPLPGIQAVSALNKLIFSNQIQAIAANFWNPAIPIISPITNKKNIPVFHTAIADDYIINAGDLVFSTNAKTSDEAKIIAQYSIEKLKAKTAVILYIGTNWGEEYAKHIEKSFTNLGGELLLIDLTSLQTTDYRAILSKVRSLKPDVLFACYFGTNLGIVLKQAKENGLNIPIMATYESEDDSVINTAKDAAEGLLFFVPEDDSQVTAKNFIKKFEASYHYLPKILSKNSYDATKILISTLNTCKEDMNCFKKNVYNIKNYPGASGNFSINEDGAATKKFVLKTIRDGQFVILADSR